jgi:hypothetical protein
MRKRHKRRLHVCQCEMCRQHAYGKIAQDHKAINRVVASLDEKSRRRLAGLLALQMGRGGLERVHEITGLSRTTIRVGRAELCRQDRRAGVRRSGGGHKAVEKNAPAF